MRPIGLLAALAAPLALAACASAPTVALPPPLAVGADEAWVATLGARGVQVYECRAGATGPAWAFVAPDATLADAGGRPAGSHGAGPFWQAPDGSRAGRLEPVHRIRRVHTTGGAAPADGCDAASVGRQARVPYTADYLLYVRR